MLDLSPYKVVILLVKSFMTQTRGGVDNSQTSETKEMLQSHTLSDFHIGIFH